MLNLFLQRTWNFNLPLQVLGHILGNLVLYSEGPRVEEQVGEISAQVWGPEHQEHQGLEINVSAQAATQS
jgi:hypothetical protein